MQSVAVGNRTLRFGDTTYNTANIVSISVQSTVVEVPLSVPESRHNRQLDKQADRADRLAASAPIILLIVPTAWLVTSLVLLAAPIVGLAVAGVMFGSIVLFGNEIVRQLTSIIDERIRHNGRYYKERVLLHILIIRANDNNVDAIASKSGEAIERLRFQIVERLENPPDHVESIDLSGGTWITGDRISFDGDQVNIDGDQVNQSGEDNTYVNQQPPTTQAALEHQG